MDERNIFTELVDNSELAPALYSKLFQHGMSYYIRMYDDAIYANTKEAKLHCQSLIRSWMPTLPVWIKGGRH